MDNNGLVSTSIQTSGSSALSSYPRLRLKVRQTLLEGQQNIDRQKVLTYWQTGKHIHEHLFFHEGRAEHYGKAVIERLSADLEISSKILYQCLQGYRTFKNFHARGNSQLLPPTWAHLRAAMRIPDEKKRLSLIRQAVEEDWKSRKLEIEVRNHNWSERKRLSKLHGKRASVLPVVCLGPFYMYQIISPETIHSRARELLLDLGFSHVLEMSVFPQARFAPGSIVTSAKDARGRYSVVKVKEASPDSLYTYKAYVERVLDGDTLKLEFQLGFGNRMRETIRLNGIDCPEIDTPKGRAAKKFVEAELAGSEFITVKSIRTRKEKWGRYLGDVFYARNAKGPLIYLNQLLLEKGLAVKIRM